MLIAQVSDLIKAADHASMQSDRWAMFASLLLLLFFGYLVIKHLVNQNGVLVKDHALAREKFHDSLEAMINKQAALTERMATIITQNTEALRECRVAFTMLSDRAKP